MAFLAIVTEMLNDRDRGLKDYLLSTGMRNSVNHFSWITVALLFSLYYSFIYTISGYLFNWEIFIKVPLVLIFGYFFSTIFSMLSLSLLISVLTSNPKNGFSLAYAFLLLSFFFQGFFTDPNSLNFLYADDEIHDYTIIKILRYLFEHYPGYTYTKLWSDFVAVSGSHFNMKTMNNEKGRAFLYEDLFEKRSDKFPDGRISIIPSPYDTFSMILINIFWVFSLTFLIDYLRYNSDKIKRKFKTSKHNVNLGGMREVEVDIEDESVMEEREITEAIYNNKDFEGILVQGISKDFRISTSFFKSKVLKALDNVTFNLQKGHLLSILGQNGAGKTTLINILNSKLKAKTGRAKIFSYDLQEEKESIKHIISLCPQFDIYWPYLTVTEHMEIFCTMRGIPKIRFIEEIAENLEKVNLIEKCDSLVSELSGGMKRRLSIAICIIGNPKVLFFDEPTTGLDPINQAEIMKLIEVLFLNLFFIFRPSKKTKQ